MDRALQTSLRRWDHSGHSPAFGRPQRLHKDGFAIDTAAGTITLLGGHTAVILSVYELSCGRAYGDTWQSERPASPPIWA